MVASCFAIPTLPGCYRPCRSLSLCAGPPKQHKHSRASRQRDGGVGTAPHALNRLLFAPSELSRDGSVTILPTDARAHHVRTVLRMPEAVRAGVLDQHLLDNVPVESIADTEEAPLRFRLADACVVTRPLPPVPNVTLLLAMPRPKVLARLIPQIAALGVSHIALINAYKVENCYFDSFILRDPAEMRDLLLHGVSQAATDARLPTVSVHRRLKVFLEDTLPTMTLCTGLQQIRLLAHPAEASTPIPLLPALATAFGAQGSPPAHTILAVGPEGGWMPREVTMLEQMFGFRRVSLGNRVLRTDAAVLVLLGIIHEFMRATEWQTNRDDNDPVQPLS